MSSVDQGGGEAQPRIRRRPEDARREILEAADALLRERPFQELSVAEVMKHTTLKRNSFYAYFGNRYDLLIDVVEPVGHKFDQAHAIFLEGGADLLASGHEAMLRVARIFAEDGALISALREASPYDARAKQYWEAITQPEPLIAGFAAKIREETRAGTMVELDPEGTSRALLAMNIQCFLHQLAGGEDADVEHLAEVLLTIWTRTLLRDPGSAQLSASERKGQ